MDGEVSEPLDVDVPSAPLDPPPPSDELVPAGNADASPGAADVGTHGHEHPSRCPNCGSDLSGAFCAGCGQPAHLHRSLSAIGHDILHGVVHFDGRLWRTLPELFFHPGRLTRRYVEGERTKFISPMALFMFTIFVVFLALPSMTSRVFKVHDVGEAATHTWTQWTRAEREAIEAGEQRAEARRDAPDATPETRAAATRELDELRARQKTLDGLAPGDWAGLGALDEPGDPEVATPLARRVLDKLANPSLLVLQIKSTAYKLSWLLIPMSLPLLWLMFLGRRDVQLYDHGIFATYSWSFMMILTLLLSLGVALGVPGGFAALAFQIVPPLHVYRQFREAYGLGRLGSAWRTVFFLVGLFAIALFFVVSLLLLGLMG